MLLLAWKNLLQERTRLAVSLGGVAAALFLVLLLEGIFAGASDQLVAYLEQSDADAWVMQEGVSNMHMSTSVVPANMQGAIEGVDGVDSATPILYATIPIRTGERRWLSYVVGVPPGAERGGPWAMASGSAEPGPGEIVIPDVMAAKSGLRLGDSIELLGRSFRVSGLSQGTFSMANTVAFISYADMAELLGAHDVASYFLVKAAPGLSAATLVDELQRSLPGVNVLTREQFVASDRALAQQMGVEIIQVMSLIGFVVGALVIGLTMYTATVRRAREYGVAKALGARDRQLLGAVGFQSLAIAAGGLVLALAIAFAARPLLGAVAPEVPLAFPATGIGRLAVVTLGIALAASLLPAYRIARLEPAMVFKE